MFFGKMTGPLIAGHSYKKDSLQTLEHNLVGL